jgi:hypothetical protein
VFIMFIINKPKIFCMFLRMTLGVRKLRNFRTGRESVTRIFISVEHSASGNRTEYRSDPATKWACTVGIQSMIDKGLYTYRIPREAKNLVLYAPHWGHMKATFGLFLGVIARNWPMDPDNKQHNYSLYSVHVCVGNSLVICKSPLASVREDPSCS